MVLVNSMGLSRGLLFSWNPSVVHFKPYKTDWGILMEGYPGFLEK